jgi:hypothetical protein
VFDRDEMLRLARAALERNPVALEMLAACERGPIRLGFGDARWRDNRVAAKEVRLTSFPLWNAGSRHDPPGAQRRRRGRARSAEVSGTQLAG